MGTLSAKACDSPPTEFSAPAAFCVTTTPKRSPSLMRL